MMVQYMMNHSKGTIEGVKYLNEELGYDLVIYK